MIRSRSVGHYFLRETTADVRNTQFVAVRHTFIADTRRRARCSVRKDRYGKHSGGGGGKHWNVRRAQPRSDTRK